VATLLGLLRGLDRA
jgi:hypothetical protein